MEVVMPKPSKQYFHKISAVDASDLEIELNHVLEQYSESEASTEYFIKQIVPSEGKSYLVIIDVYNH